MMLTSLLVILYVTVCFAADNKLCDIIPTKRVDCGYPKILQVACENQGCCYNTKLTGIRCYKAMINGGWSSWTTGSCTVTCQSPGVDVNAVRTRSCNNPAPFSGGADCVGDSTMTVACAIAPPACPPVCDPTCNTCASPGVTGCTSCKSPAVLTGTAPASCVDVCSSAPCQNGGICTRVLKSYTCTCRAGYTGSNCQTNINECLSAPCVNGGTCIDGVNAYTCTCVAGYTGSTCQTNVNECASSPCLHGGTCTDGINMYTCACVARTTGKNCDCTTNSTCPPGYVQSGCSCYMITTQFATWYAAPALCRTSDSRAHLAIIRDSMQEAVVYKISYAASKTAWAWIAGQLVSLSWKWMPYANNTGVTYMGHQHFCSSPDCSSNPCAFYSVALSSYSSRECTFSMIVVCEIEI